MLPSEPSFKKNLGMIDRLIGGEWSVDEFETAYYDYFVDTVPSSFLSDEDEDFFAAVQERLDWTARNPTNTSNGYVRNVSFTWDQQAETCGSPERKAVRQSAPQGRRLNFPLDSLVCVAAPRLGSPEGKPVQRLTSAR